MKIQLSTVMLNVDGCHYDTARPQNVEGGVCLQVRRTAVSVLN